MTLDAVKPAPDLKKVIGDVGELELGPPGLQTVDTPGVSVYGSKFAAMDLPKHEMPEGEMPKEIAYRMINLASFVTTYMEDEAEKLMNAALGVNMVDLAEYRSSADIQNRCVNMIARLFNSPPTEHGSNAMGTATVGSSEAIILAVLAMKKIWQKRRIAEGKDTSKPNIVMNSAVQVCWEKAARYLEVEEKYAYCTKDRYVLDPEEAVDLCDENTIGICVILGTTYTGEYEDVKAVNDLLIKKGVNVPIHVDAASGGFVAPFINPYLEWDFRLEKVVSINVSGHKYGLVYPGIGWCIWKSKDFLPQELVFNINYLGEDQASFTLNFSRGASQIIGQYYQLLRLGKQGYRNIMINLTQTSDYLAACLEKLGFIIMSATRGKGLPLVAFRINPDDDYHFDEFAIAHQLRERGWIVPAYTMAPHSEKLKLMRVVVREDFSRSKAHLLLTDIKAAVENLKAMDKASIEQQLARAKAGTSGDGKKKTETNTAYSGETHSLQGKHGKTHAVC